MTIYILDTDHLSLYGRNHPILVAKLLAAKIQLTTTAINVEEQLRGRLAQVAEAKDGVLQSNAYQRLIETVMLLSEFNILQYDEKSQDIQYLSVKGKRGRGKGKEKTFNLYPLTLSPNPMPS